MHEGGRGALIRTYQAEDAPAAPAAPPRTQVHLAPSQRDVAQLQQPDLVVVELDKPGQGDPGFWLALRIPQQRANVLPGGIHQHVHRLLQHVRVLRLCLQVRVQLRDVMLQECGREWGWEKGMRFRQHHPR